jgi:NitT/TauT family transport system ATP-binding protein
MEYRRAKRETRTLALADLSLTVDDGKFVAIVGPSGCGKTTFIKIVDGLIRPSSGQIFIDGKEVAGPGPDRAMVFQDSSLLPWRTVYGNVIYGLECQNRDDTVGRERVRDLLRLVGIANFANHYPHELSGGMQQRCNIARALAVDPEVLLMDEPFAALDAQTRELMQQELLRIWQQARKTVLFVTHQISEAAYLADRVVVFTARPGSVKCLIDIDMERPRPLRIKRDRRFLEYEDQIWSSIEAEVHKASAGEQMPLDRN